ncbi:hypothetical protein AH03_32 [Erwinia phage AH03]|uniref:Uncharacterized protein n=1 Tax=Erwinia phage AH03 TaxID=2869568 RepID=A0AAE7X0A0_9CAUD|nr:hypothetical protein AH03_32 [Erwinia phage AH03]
MFSKFIELIKKPFVWLWKKEETPVSEPIAATEEVTPVPVTEVVPANSVDVEKLRKVLAFAGVDVSKLDTYVAMANAI